MTETTGELETRAWQSHKLLLLRNGTLSTAFSDACVERMFRVRTPGLECVGLVRAELQVRVNAKFDCNLY